MPLIGIVRAWLSWLRLRPLAVLGVLLPALYVLGLDAADLLGPMVLGFGGDGGSTSSSNSTSTSTTNVDKRQVVDTNSVGVSSDSSTVNVTATDHNTVKQAFDLAKTSSEQNKDTINKALGYTQELLKFGSEATKLVQQSAANVGDAYKTAQDSATGLRFVVAAGMVVAGIVAVANYKKLKGA